MAAKPEGFDSLEEVAEAIRRYQPHRRRPRGLDGLAKNVRLGCNGKYHWHWDPRYRAGPRDLERRPQRMEASARQIAIPTLLVRGGLSNVLSEAGAQHFLALCPSSQYVNVTDAGHMVAGERNDIFANSVIDFLARMVPVASRAVRSPESQGAAATKRGDDINDVP